MVTRRTGVQRVDVSGVNTLNGSIQTVFADATASAYANVKSLQDGRLHNAAGLVVKTDTGEQTVSLLEQINGRLHRIETYLAYLADGEMQ